MPDPRTRPNRLYPWQLLWALISAAMASACHNPAAIGRTIKEHRDDLFAVLPATLRRLPSESTIRRTLSCVDAKMLDTALTTPPTPAPAPPLPSVAAELPTPLVGQVIDGKAIRGVGRDGHPCLLVGLVAHGSTMLLAQAEVACKRDERSVVPDLLSGRDLQGRVITLDALHTLKTTARLTWHSAATISWWSKRTKPRCTSFWTCSSACLPTKPITKSGIRQDRRAKKAMGGWKRGA